MVQNQTKSDKKITGILCGREDFAEKITGILCGRADFAEEMKGNLCGRQILPRK